MAAALDTLDSRSHLSRSDHSGWTLGADGLTDGGVELVDVLAVRLEHLQSVTLESLGDRISAEVVGGVTPETSADQRPGVVETSSRDGNVVVIDEDFDIETPRHSQSRGLGIISLLLRSI